VRRKILTIGLILIVAGVFTIEQGPQFLSPIAQSVGFASHVQAVNPILPPTLLPIPPSNYTSYSSNLSGGVQVQGTLQVTDGREIAFYVMDEGNFSLWREGRPSAIILARPTAISYNFTFTPTTSGTYFFVFDNQDTARRVVIFSLDSVENLTILNPIVEFSGYEVFLVGFALSVFGIRAGKKRESISTEAGWKCRFCGAINTGDQTFCEHCKRSQR
jgi:hypothetical protein